MVLQYSPWVHLMVDEGDKLCVNVRENEAYVDVDLTVTDPGDEYLHGDITISIEHPSRSVYADAFRKIADALEDPGRQGFHHCPE